MCIFINNCKSKKIELSKDKFTRKHFNFLKFFFVQPFIYLMSRLYFEEIYIVLHSQKIRMIFLKGDI